MWNTEFRQEYRKESKSNKIVFCHPSIEDPLVYQWSHRAVCLVRPYLACQYCQNRNFITVFGSHDNRYETVMCPRWTDDLESPAEYVTTEIATCQESPFLFCGSCPSKEELLKDFGVDKSKQGWFGRWKRIIREEQEEDGRF